MSPTLNRTSLPAHLSNAWARWLAKTLLLLLAVCALPTGSSAQILLAIRYGNDGWKMSNVAAEEAWQGKRNAAILLFTNFCNQSTYINNLFATQLPNIWKSGHVPIISWQPKACPGASTPADIDVQIETGAFDPYLQTWFTRLKQFLAGPDGIYGTADDRRVYIRLAHEMNGDWYPWSATTGGSYGNPGSGNTVADYIGMWQHVHNALAALGVDGLHVQWIWCPNATDSPYSHPLEDYYPGDAYVDWVGVDGYNFGGSRWISAKDRFTTPFSRLYTLAPTKPLSVPETGTVDLTSTGAVSITAKNSWLTNAYSFFSGARVKLVSYFDVDMASGNAYGVFGGSSGDLTFSYNGITYTAFSGYRNAVAAGAFVASNLTNPRLLTDAQFTGAAASGSPTAQLSLSPSSGTVPLPVNASATLSSGTAISSTIDFGDGTVMSGPSASHTYSGTGTYTVTATVIDSLGQSSKATGLVTVSKTATAGVIANLVVSPTSGAKPLKVTASTSGSTGTPVTIDFGDGIVVAGTTASHTYSHTGAYTITATVRSASGTAKATARVTVYGSQDFQLQWSGGTATQLNRIVFPVSVIPVGGPFNQAVQLQCAGLPSFATCVFSPAAVVPGTRSRAAQVTLVLNNRPLHRFAALILPFWAFALIGIAAEFRRRRVIAIVFGAVLILALLLSLTGCGAANMNVSPAAADARVNSFSFAVVGTSGGVQHSIRFTATVGRNSSSHPAIANLTSTPTR